MVYFNNVKKKVKSSGILLFTIFKVVWHFVRIGYSFFSHSQFEQFEFH